MKNTEWKKIDDTSVKNVWCCERCEIEISVDPGFYQENGNPMCSDCDDEMVYLHTMIRTKG